MKRGNPNIAEAGKKTQFKPGQSGNPAGMPKGYVSSKVMLKKLLAIEVVGLDVEGNESKITVEEEMHAAIVNKARKGDIFAYDKVTKLLEDKEAQQVTVTFASEVNAMPDGKFTDIIKSLHGSDGDTGD